MALNKSLYVQDCAAGCSTWPMNQVHILLGLLAALAYGSSDFAAGIGGRGVGATRVALSVHLLALISAVAGLAIFPSHALNWSTTAWGILAGLSSVIGTLSLYRGLAIGQMSVVAPVSGVVAAGLPAIVGLLGGDHLSSTATVGLVLALPAIAMVSFQTTDHAASDKRRTTGLLEGALGGAGFGCLFISIDHAGGDAGTWPLVIGFSVACLVLVLVVFRSRARPSRSPRLWAAVAAAGLLAGTANLLFLGASLSGELTIVSVLTALYPAVTIVLARLLLDERWNRIQIAGLGAAAIAVLLISWG